MALALSWLPRMPVIPDSVKQQIAPTISVETTTTASTTPPAKTNLVRNLVVGSVLALGGLGAYWFLAPKKAKPAAASVAGLFGIKRKRRRR